MEGGGEKGEKKGGREEGRKGRKVNHLEDFKFGRFRGPSRRVGQGCCQEGRFFCLERKNLFRDEDVKRWRKCQKTNPPKVCLGREPSSSCSLSSCESS